MPQGLTTGGCCLCGCDESATAVAGNACSATPPNHCCGPVSSLDVRPSVQAVPFVWRVVVSTGIYCKVYPHSVSE